MKKTLKRLIACVAVVLTVFALCTTAFAGTTGYYNGSCTNQFTCDEDWNKENDTRLQNANTYARLYNKDESGTEVAFTSRFAVGSYTKDVLTSSRNTVSWTNTRVGKAKLTIVNQYYNGTRMYVKGYFTLHAS